MRKNERLEKCVSQIDYRRRPSVSSYHNPRPDAAHPCDCSQFQCHRYLKRSGLSSGVILSAVWCSRRPIYARDNKARKSMVPQNPIHTILSTMPTDLSNSTSSPLHLNHFNINSHPQPAQQYSCSSGNGEKRWKVGGNSNLYSDLTFFVHHQNANHIPRR